MKKIAFSLLFLAVTLACSSDDESGTSDGSGPEETVSFDRSALLSNWADNIITPGYEDFVTKVNTLEVAVNTFNASLDTNSLEELRSSWLEAYTTWQRVSMFEIGPAETANLRSNVNIYPSDVTLIEDNIASGTYDLDLPSNRVAKGFPALDYLLFGEASDTEVLAEFTGNANAQQYLLDVVLDIKTLATQVRDQWQGAYRDTFVSNDGSSSTASVDRFVNDYIFYYEKFLRAGKMGIPGGVFSGTPAPQNIEALYNGEVSKQLFLEGLDATQDFFNGVAYNGVAQGESLSSYLDTLNTVKDGVDLNTIINTQFDEARTAVQSLGSFASELEVNPPTTFLNAYDQVQVLVPLLKVDMVSAMSISIDFADADGD